MEHENHIKQVILNKTCNQTKQNTELVIKLLQGSKPWLLTPIDPSPKWRPKIQISKNQKRMPALERTPLL